MFRQKQFVILILLLFCSYVILMPRSGLPYDMDCWKRWSIFIYEHGLSNIYKSDTDYLPLYHYVLAAFAFLQGSVQNIENNIHYLKIFTLLFDFAAGFFLYQLIMDKFKSPGQAFIKSLFYFLNIAIFYDTLIWGQVDGIMSCLIFGSFYYAYRRREVLSLVLFVLALNFKFQSIIFLPLIGLMVLPSILKQLRIENFIYPILATVILQALILSQFVYAGTMDRLWESVRGSIGRYPFVSMSAYNVWTLFKALGKVTGTMPYLVNGNLAEISDSQTALGLSLKSWGLLLFCVCFLVAIYPLLRSTFHAIKSKSYLEMPLDKLLIIGALTPLLFFYFNTQMHERYSHAAFVFLIAYCILRKRVLAGVLGCLAYVLNLEHVLHFLQLKNYDSVIFFSPLIAVMYLITIALLYADLWDITLHRTGAGKSFSAHRITS